MKKEKTIRYQWMMDICTVGWFISMLSGIILEKTFTVFEYSFSFIFGLYVLVRIFYWLKSRNTSELRSKEPEQ